MNRATFLALLGICCTLTMGGSGEIQGTNYTINQDGITITASDDFDITLGSTGSITNASNDFTVDEDGFTIGPALGMFSPSSGRAYRINYGNGNFMGGLWGDVDGADQVILRAENDILLFPDGDLLIDGGDKIVIDLDMLPTSDPLNPGQVYRDGSTLKVSLTT